MAAAGFILRGVAQALIGEGVKGVISKRSKEVQKAREKAANTTKFDTDLQELFTKFAGSDGKLDLKELTSALESKSSPLGG